VRAEAELAAACEEIRRRDCHLYKYPHCHPGHECCLYGAHHCGRHVVEKVIYAKTPSEQEVVDLLLKASAPLDELKTKFGIK
jgi:hypothetical protein